MTLIDKAEAHDDDLIRRGDVLRLVIGTADIQRGPSTDMQRMIRAVPARGVGVKPLVWIEIEDDDCDFEAFASGLRYWIVSVTDHQHTVKCNTYEIGDCLTVEKAKAAAQADYEARILAALAPSEAGGVDLSSPVAVHLNMLRGTIAKPTVEQIIHLYGFDALLTALRPQIMAELGTPLDQVVTAEADPVPAHRRSPLEHERDDAQVDAGGVEVDWGADVGREVLPDPVDALVKAAEAIADDACSYICPSTGKAGTPIPHDPRCVALRAAIADAKGGRDA